MTRKGDDCSRSAVVKIAADPGMECLCDAESAVSDRLSLSFFTGLIGAGQYVGIRDEVGRTSIRLLDTNLG